jgi:hypothetical protein
MDPTEIVKHIPEAAAAIASSSIVTDLVKKMLGPAADEVGEWGRDKIKAYRTQNATKVLEEAGRMLHEAQIEPEPVPPKILLPLLDGASLEDSEDMQKMWAALLANAASPENERVRPGFISTLRQLSTDEAETLQRLHKFYIPEQSILPLPYMDIGHALPPEPHEMMPDSEEMDNYRSRLMLCVSSLQVHGLIEYKKDKRKHLFTMYGYEFVSACQPPAPEAKS